jgi:hypothetical protein
MAEIRTMQDQLTTQLPAFAPCSHRITPGSMDECSRDDNDWPGGRSRDQAGHLPHHEKEGTS